MPATASLMPPKRSISVAWIGTWGVRYFEKISRAPARSGRSTRIRTSRRPGRNTAGSIMSARLDAPMITTLSRDSTPSISARSCGTIIVSTSEDTPVPRVRNSASISSKKMTTGVSPAARVRARAKMARIWRSVSPTNLFSSSGPLIDRKNVEAPPRFDSELATAFAIRVLPEPGGPYRRMPLGGRRPNCRYSSGWLNGISIESRTCAI